MREFFCDEFGGQTTEEWHLTLEMSMESVNGVNDELSRRD